MDLKVSQPRILLISQWPSVKNGEYELIEKIKQTGYRITVVDFFGFNVDTGENLNGAALSEEYDFAISFHYDTPKFLNLPTYLWVANPLEFMHLRGEYRNVLMHHLRSYDDYLYNGSDVLKTHIENVLGSAWRESGLEMYPACSIKSLIPPKAPGEVHTDAARKIFYCGVNWERGSDRDGRAQGLLSILQEKNAADFYGPNKLEGISPWEGFTSYKGEIPFDGVTMSHVMRDYGAVLAVSSPAHFKSKTSSSRVFEGFAAGVPVISDENAHVRKTFGDLVYYFMGDSEEERAASLLAALERIRSNPDDAYQRVQKAQQLLASRYCFEACFDRILQRVRSERSPSAAVAASSLRNIDIFLFHHEGDPLASNGDADFSNSALVLHAASHVARALGMQIRIVWVSDRSPDTSREWQTAPGVELVVRHPSSLTDTPWHKLRLGEKVALLAAESDADLLSFFTQFDFPHYDHFTKAANWFQEDEAGRRNALHVGGFFVNELSHKAPAGTAGILRNNMPNAMYQWTQNSLAEHQLGALTFGRGALELCVPRLISRFDSILPVALISLAVARKMPVHRSRYITVRVRYGHFQRHYNAYVRAARKGFWSQHYDLVTNYNHELNALYDIQHESPEAISIADKVSGHSLNMSAPVDPAVHAVNQFISRLRPIYRWSKQVRSVFTLRS